MDGNGSVVNTIPSSGTVPEISHMDLDVGHEAAPPNPLGDVKKGNGTFAALQARGISVGLSKKFVQQLDQVTGKLTALPNASTVISPAKISNPAESSAKKRKNDNCDAAVPTNNLSNNRFALLASLEVQQINNDIVSDRVSTTIPNDKVNKTGLLKKTPQSSNNTNARFCPPIVLHNVDINSLATQFKNNFPDLKLKIINKSKFVSKLYIQDYEAYTQIMTLLKEKGISSHSFTPIQNKQFSLIIRGLHHLMNPNDIKEELDTLAPGVVDSVKEFQTQFMRKNNLKSSLFQVTLLPGKVIKDINIIRSIAFQRITWEKPKNNAKEVQCKKCQRWGHIAKNCNHPYQCVKCDKLHAPGLCGLVKSEDSAPFCINCKQFGHPANFRGCETYKKFADAKKANSQRKVPSRGSFINAKVTPGKSFASLFARNTYTKKSSNTKLIEEFLAIAKELLQTEAQTIEQRIENFISNFKSMSTEHRKSECLQILQLLNSEHV